MNCDYTFEPRVRLTKLICAMTPNQRDIYRTILADIDTEVFLVESCVEIAQYILDVTE